MRNTTAELGRVLFNALLFEAGVAAGAGAGAKSGAEAVKEVKKLSPELKAVVKETDEVADAAKETEKIIKGGSGTGHKSLKDLLGSGKTGDFSNIKGETIEEILSRIPEDAQMRVLKPVAGKVETGVEFSWKVEDKTMRVRIHGIDPSAPSGSNAANGWIVRVQEGKKYLDPDTEIFQPPGISNADSPFYNPDLVNNTHILIQTPEKEIVDELIKSS